MVKIILHAGPDKTGTTTIQRFCKAHGALLAQYSIVYPVDECMTHSGLLTAAFLDNPYKLPFAQRFERKILQQKIAEEKLRVRDAAATKGAGSILLSHEGMHVLGKHELLQYRDFITAISGRVQLLYYVRDPYDYARSAISQRVISGLDPEKSDVPLLNHREILKRYVAMFGKSRIFVRVYSKDILEKFLIQIGIEASVAAACSGASGRRNLRMSATALEVGTRLIRMLVKHGIDTRGFERIVGENLRSIPGPEISLTREQVQTIEAGSRNSIWYLEEEFGIRAPQRKVRSSPMSEIPDEDTNGMVTRLFREYVDSAETVPIRTGIDRVDSTI